MPLLSGKNIRFFMFREKCTEWIIRPGVEDYYKSGSEAYSFICLICQKMSGWDQIVITCLLYTSLSGFIGLDNPDLVNPGVSISLLSNAGGHLASTFNNLRMFRICLLYTSWFSLYWVALAQRIWVFICGVRTSFMRNRRKTDYIVRRRSNFY